MLVVISRCLTVFALFTCLHHVSGSSCTTLCPGLSNGGKCCDDEFQSTALSSTHDNETDGFPKIDMWTLFVGLSSLIGVVFVVIVICSYCPCCILYKRRKNGGVYRRFGRANNPSGQRRKSFVNRGVQRTNTSVPPINQTSSVTIVASYPVQNNVPQPCAPGQMLGQHLYNHLPQPQAGMQPPPPCTVISYM